LQLSALQLTCDSFKFNLNAQNSCCFILNTKALMICE
jgi:hypothetical protein